MCNSYCPLVWTIKQSNIQISFKKGLIKNIATFKTDVQNFYADFTKNGMLIKGLALMEAANHLSHFRE